MDINVYLPIYIQFECYHRVCGLFPLHQLRCEDVLDPGSLSRTATVECNLQVDRPLNVPAGDRRNVSHYIVVNAFKIYMLLFPKHICDNYAMLRIHKDSAILRIYKVSAILRIHRDSPLLGIHRLSYFKDSQRFRYAKDS